LDFNVSAKEAEITAKRAMWTLKLMNAADFPDVPDVLEQKFDTLDRKVFLAAVQRTASAAPADTYRPELSILNIADGKVQATDGVRFHQTLLKYDGNVQIPVQAVEDLIRFLRMVEDEKIQIAQSENHVVFKFGVDTFIATKATATFPNVEKALLVPARESCKDKLIVDRQQLADGIKRVRLTADVDTNLVVLALADGLLTLSSKDRDGNRAVQELDVAWKKGERKLGFNWIYLLDSLGAVSSDKVTALIGPDSKQKKTAMILEDTGFVAVLNQLRMPI